MVEVTQADRKAAADILDVISSLLDHVGIGQVADLIRDGEYDEHDVMPIIARHRIAERDKIVAWLRSLQRSLHLTHRYAVAADFFANAIEAGEHDHD